MFSKWSMKGTEANWGTGHVGRKRPRLWELWELLNNPAPSRSGGEEVVLIG